MAKIIEFTVYGDPKSQKRHRTFQRGKFTGRYDPSAKNKQDFLLAVQNNAPDKPISEPILLRLGFGLRRPKNHYGTGRNAGKLKDNAPTAHIKKPDLDNLIKFILDALNGVFWLDDNLIFKIFAHKIYSDKPQTQISIETKE